VDQVHFRLEINLELIYVARLAVPLPSMGRFSLGVDIGNSRTALSVYDHERQVPGLVHPGLVGWDGGVYFFWLGPRQSSPGPPPPAGGGARLLGTGISEEECGEWTGLVVTGAFFVFAGVDRMGVCALLERQLWGEILCGNTAGALWEPAMGGEMFVYEHQR